MKYTIVLAAAATLGLCTGAYAQANTEPAGQNRPVQEQLGNKHDPGTVGAMQGPAGNLATSPEDVRRQTQGKPTQQQQALQRKAQPANPDPTRYPAGTVGAAPGTEAPMPGTKK